ncbi:MAG: hypothetical protein JJE29_01415 [Peptostreptococcaceae bacterium]|nr:hypothetical protein [Peptostreptococcaceae bacterium]
MAKKEWNKNDFVRGLLGTINTLKILAFGRVFVLLIMYDFDFLSTFEHIIASKISMAYSENLHFK